MIKILDCTFRDGGYYTDWDFDEGIVDTYINAMENLPIDYIEVGYRSKPSSVYMGEYAYCPTYRLSLIKKKTRKKIAIMLNERDTLTVDLVNLLEPIIGIVDMVRIAIDPQNIERAIVLAESIKNLGFEVGFNLMYMSKWIEINIFSDILHKVNEVADLFCMVDSFGSVTPDVVKQTINEVRKYITIPIGFHAHNNLELSLSNAITSIEEGVDFIDSTILGMGRGAGNLKTELLLTYLNKYMNLKVDFNMLGEVVQSFNLLHEKCKWGTNLPYMISGVNSFPQKEVMEWVNNRSYSFNNIVRALDNKKENIHSQKEYPHLENVRYESALIIGGGESAIKHFEGIRAFLKLHPKCVIIHATTRNALLYQELTDHDQYFCLVGSEAQRMKKIFQNIESIRGKCILSPFSRKMGTDIPHFMENKIYQLDDITFTDIYNDSCTALALELAIDTDVSKIFVTGYDGYPNGLSNKEIELSKENETLFNNLSKKYNIPLISITQTLYNGLTINSLYESL